VWSIAATESSLRGCFAASLTHVALVGVTAESLTCASIAQARCMLAAGIDEMYYAILRLQSEMHEMRSWELALNYCLEEGSA
jgi:hypothetical protein